MHRDDFAKLMDQFNCKHAVELGVATGYYSEVLARAHLDELVLVDKWNDHHNEEERRMVVAKFKEDPRVRILHMLFEEAAKLFSDGYFDFVYVDGYAHTGQDNGKTLEVWWPKLKRGGIFAGHDYHPIYQPTVDAVNAFCAQRELTFCTTEEAFYPSWYLVKP